MTAWKVQNVINWDADTRLRAQVRATTAFHSQNRDDDAAEVD
jgi:hypothetical protein